MNKIIIDNDKISKKSIDKCLEVNIIEKSELFDVNTVEITVSNNTSLEIICNSNLDNKLNIFIYVNENVSFDLYELRCGGNNKIKYQYFLKDNSEINIDKFYDCNSIKEVDLINLDGIRSKINYNFRTIAKNKEKYDIVVYHNNMLSSSNINNYGVNIKDGSIIFNVTSVVDNGVKECVINQNSRIVTFNNNKCIINPNLLIDENDVEANHSAHIGKFDDNQLFYLMRLGIPINDAYKLLIRGFLLNKANNNLEKKEEILNKYWG